MEDCRNDTIHNLLAYLAEQMIELNKKKNDETKGFLKWLEREIGAEIESLANKTAIKEYHEHNIHDLVKKIPVGYKSMESDWGNPSGKEVW